MRNLQGGGISADHCNFFFRTLGDQNPGVHSKSLRASLALPGGDAPSVAETLNSTRRNVTLLILRTPGAQEEATS
jgi:hypothetical protein